MADQTMLAPLGCARDSVHQCSISATGTATAGKLAIIIPDATPNEAVIDALQLALDACLRDPTKYKA